MLTNEAERVGWLECQGRITGWPKVVAHPCPFSRAFEQFARPFPCSLLNGAYMTGGLAGRAGMHTEGLLAVIHSQLSDALSVPVEERDGHLAIDLRIIRPATIRMPHVINWIPEALFSFQGSSAGVKQ